MEWGAHSLSGDFLNDLNIEKALKYHHYCESQQDLRVQESSFGSFEETVFEAL